MVRGRLLSFMSPWLLVGLCLFATRSSLAPALAASCANPVVCENALPGNPQSEWGLSGTGDPSIVGFATDISINKGSTVSFKISTNASAYSITIYRLGYYGGLGARQVASVQPSAPLPQTQPPCLTDTSTQLVDCGNWSVSASWAVPSTATSGIYLAKLVRADTGGANHIVFVVRDDSSTSDLLFQTSDTTWQAYNDWGGVSLYTGSSPSSWGGAAYKVSYNRPFANAQHPGNWVFNAEYPMVSWLEANGYDVSYFSGVDSDRNGALIRNHKVFLSVGHDEYWSGNQRSNVEAARAAGINLAFFSGNEIFWKTRWEPSIDGTDTGYRTLVCYKETENGRVDPDDPTTWTGTWMDPTGGAPDDAAHPENALTGAQYLVNNPSNYAITIPSDFAKLRFWRNTSIASLQAGQDVTLPTGTLGFEWDGPSDNGSQPAGLIRLSSATLPISGQLLQDYGSEYGSGNATHSMTLYRDASGALVFAAGTIQWTTYLSSSLDMQQATLNLLSDMGAQPATIQPGLVTASPTTDSLPPTSQITSPSNGWSVANGSSVTITGTATDAGGGAVGGVEVSVDGGTTWHSASGRESWTYVWTPGSAGTYNLRSRAVDDSGNLETSGVGITITVTSRSCPCSIWNSVATPIGADQNDTSAIEVGVQFTADVSGYVTGVRFYKGSLNTGTHVGNLWTSTGALLASATFTNETASGWQEVDFASPVAIAPNTVYIASYHTNVGGYAKDGLGFATSNVDDWPLHALMSGVNGMNGVYAYSATSTFPDPNQSYYLAPNFWVDVVFTTSSTSSPTATSSPTPTASPTLTLTASSTPTSTPTIAPTLTSSPTSTPTVSPTSADIPSATPSDSPTATGVPKPTPTLTSTPTDLPTATSIASPTATDIPTVTSTLSPTPTMSPTPSNTATSTAVPTATPTISPTPTAAYSPTYTPTLTVTRTPTSNGGNGKGKKTSTPTRTATPSSHSVAGSLGNLVGGLDAADPLADGQ